MKNMHIEEVYTGGGCDHLEIHFKQYGLFFIVNNNDCNVPKDGEDWGFCVYDSEEHQNNGNYLFCEGAFDDFKRESLLDFLKGYVAAKSFKKIKDYFDIEDVDYNSLAFDIANVCEPHVLYDALYFYIKTFSKSDLLHYLQTLDANQSFKINDYLEQ